MTAALIKQVLAAFKEQRDEIGDSDLYGEQPVTLRVSTTLGELRKVRSASYAASLPSAPAKTPPAPDVARMVNRFLGWRLPKPWHPDNGISYKRPNYGHAPADHDWPTGTNLFDAEQAKQMIEYMLEGSAAPAKTADEAVQHLIDICCTIGVDTIPAAGSGYGLVKEMLLVDLDIAQAAVQLALKSTTTKD
jgi:hypothetical protein